MSCECGAPKSNAQNKAFTRAVVEIENPESLVLFRKVVIPASMGDETDVPPAIGKYHNVLLEYEKSGMAYLYSSDGIPTRLTTPQIVGKGVLTIQFDGETIATFSANSTENVTANIQVENVNGVLM